MCCYTTFLISVCKTSRCGGLVKRDDISYKYILVDEIPQGGFFFFSSLLLLVAVGIWVGRRRRRRRERRSLPLFLFLGYHACSSCSRAHAAGVIYTLFCSRTTLLHPLPASPSANLISTRRLRPVTTLKTEHTKKSSFFPPSSSSLAAGTYTMPAVGGPDREELPQKCAFRSIHTHTYIYICTQYHVLFYAPASLCLL